MLSGRDVTSRTRDFRMRPLGALANEHGPGDLHCVVRVVHARHLLPSESLESGPSWAEGAGVISPGQIPGW